MGVPSATRAAALLATLALGLAGCGSDSVAKGEPEAQPVGEVRVGSVAQLAQCSDWTAGTPEERMATVEDVKEQINLEDGTGETPELSDDAAYEVLDNTCSQDFAGSVRLYKVYARATGFASFAE